MNEKLAKSIYLLVQSLRGEDIKGILERLEDTQWFTADQLLDMQMRRLKHILEYAYKNIPYYTKCFDEAGIKPEDIKLPSDMASLPLLDKGKIRANYDSLRVPEAKGTEKHRTSGSTGEPLLVVRDRESTGYHRANMFRLRRWYGLDIGSFEGTFRNLNYPYWERVRTRVKDFILNRVRLNEKVLDEPQMERFFTELSHVQPALFYGFPSLMVRFTRFLIERGISPAPLGLKLIIATSEMLYPDQKKLLAEFYGVPVVNEYGCTETGIIAIECPDGGLHVPVESCFIEVVKDDENPSNEGAGKVVVTDLMNRAMPFIRYEVGDLARLGTSRCSCGRGLPLIERIVGRVGKMVPLPDGRMIHSLTFFYIFKHAEDVTERSVKEFQIRFSPPNIFKFFVVPDINFNDDVKDYLLNRLQEALGAGSEVQLELVAEITQTKNGKFEKFIISDEHIGTDQLTSSPG